MRLGSIRRGCHAVCQHRKKDTGYLARAIDRPRPPGAGVRGPGPGRRGGAGRTAGQPGRRHAGHDHGDRLPRQPREGARHQACRERCGRCHRRRGHRRLPRPQPRRIAAAHPRRFDHPRGRRGPQHLGAWPRSAVHPGAHQRHRGARDRRRHRHLRRRQPRPRLRLQHLRLRTLQPAGGPQDLRGGDRGRIAGRHRRPAHRAPVRLRRLHRGDRRPARLQRPAEGNRPARHLPDQQHLRRQHLRRAAVDRIHRPHGGRGGIGLGALGERHVERRLLAGLAVHPGTGGDHLPPAHPALQRLHARAGAHRRDRRAAVPPGRSHRGGAGRAVRPLRREPHPGQHERGVVQPQRRRKAADRRARRRGRQPRQPRLRRVRQRRHPHRGPLRRTDDRVQAVGPVVAPGCHRHVAPGCAGRQFAFGLRQPGADHHHRRQVRRRWLLLGLPQQQPPAGVPLRQPGPPRPHRLDPGRDPPASAVREERVRHRAGRPELGGLVVLHAEGRRALQGLHLHRSRVAAFQRAGGARRRQRGAGGPDARVRAVRQAWRWREPLGGARRCGIRARVRHLQQQRHLCGFRHPVGRGREQSRGQRGKHRLLPAGRLQLRRCAATSACAGSPPT
jgi:hypothetical protein